MRLLCRQFCWLSFALTPSVAFGTSVSISPSSKIAPGLQPQRETEAVAAADGGLMRREPTAELPQPLQHSETEESWQDQRQIGARRKRHVFRRLVQRHGKLKNRSSSLLGLSEGAAQHQTPLQAQAPIAIIPSVGQFPNLQSMPLFAVPITQPQTVQMIVQVPQAAAAAQPAAPQAAPQAPPPVAPQAQPAAPQAAPQVAAAPTVPPSAAPATAAPKAADQTIAPSHASRDDSDGNVEHRISMSTLLCIIFSGTIVALYVAWRNLKKVYELRRGGDLLSEFVLGLTGDGSDSKGLLARVSLVSTYFAGTTSGEADDSDKTRSRSEKESEDSTSGGPRGGRQSSIRSRASISAADAAAGGGGEGQTAPKAGPTSYRDRKNRTRNSTASTASTAETGSGQTGEQTGGATHQSSYRERRSRGSTAEAPSRVRATESVETPARSSPADTPSHARATETVETPARSSPAETSSRARARETVETPALSSIAEAPPRAEEEPEPRPAPISDRTTPTPAPAPKSSYRDRKSRNKDNATTQPNEPSEPSMANTSDQGQRAANAENNDGALEF